MELEGGHGPVLTSVRQALATRNDLRGFPLAAITCLGQRAVIFRPEAAVLDAGLDDETSVFQSAGKRRTALLLTTVPCRETARAGTCQAI